MYICLCGVCISLINTSQTKPTGQNVCVALQLLLFLLSYLLATAISLNQHSGIFWRKEMWIQESKKSLLSTAIKLITWNLDSSPNTMSYKFLKLDSSMNDSNKVSLFKNENSPVNSHLTVKPPMKACFFFLSRLNLIVIKFSVCPHIQYVYQSKRGQTEPRTALRGFRGRTESNDEDLKRKWKEIPI